jgi:23S rRNA (pseudouridine1915-N3)-methyltransferase
MNIKIVAVGKMKDRELASKTEEFFDRIRHDSRIEVVELKDTGVKAEGERIAEIAGKEKGMVIVLDEKGKEYNSVEFARLLAPVNSVAFVIGGPDGLSDQARKAGKVILALSKMTFTHEMARLFLVEQIYRALSIINNRKYHK